MSDETPNQFLEMFNDPEKAATYADGPTKFVPGFADIHRMVAILLQERVPEHATILIHGAGGGLELDAFARTNPNWAFVGVDPAKAMITEARRRLDYARDRVELHCGFINEAPQGPFDGATSLLTLHFLEFDERLETVRQIVRRLKPGAPFVAVHCSFPQSETERDAWLSRYQAFAVSKGADFDMAQTARQGVANMLSLLDPQQDLRLLQEAGLQNVAPFYAAFTWRGWVGYVP